MDLTNIKELLLGQALRPDTVTLSARHRLVPGFTTTKFEGQMEAPAPRDPPNLAAHFQPLPLEELSKHIIGMAECGRGDLSFDYGDVKLVFQGTNLHIECNLEEMSLKQATTHAARLAEVIQLGRKLFDLVCRP